MTKILITGGCGFIGHHVVEHLLKNTDWEIVILDKLGYSSKGFDRLVDIRAYDNRRVQIFAADFTREITVGVAKEIGKVNYVLHMGAETHVDESITDPGRFVRANIWGTFNILEYLRNVDSLDLAIYFSTDEVFGPAPNGVNYKEWDRYHSTNPYSATKAGGEELCLAYANTYRIPIAITHTMNAFGERQHPEKFIPKTIMNVLSGRTVSIHSDATKTISGSRFYIHCRNIADAVLFIFNRANIAYGDKFNIVGEQEVTNLELAEMIASVLKKPLHYEMVDFHTSRPGHDLRYALDGGKMARLGWEPPRNLNESLEKTIQWIVDPENARWLTWV